ncbi:MAG: DUF7453 family protein [Phycisphaerales bacterium]
MSAMIRSSALLTVVGLAASAFAQAPTWQVVMRSNIGLGDPVPGMTLGEIWRTDAGPYSNPKVDNAGGVLFAGLLDTLANPGGTVTTANRRCLFYGVPGNVQLLARDGQNGTGANTFTNLNLPNPNNWAHNSSATGGTGLTDNPTIAPNGTIFVSSSLWGTGATTTTNTAFWTGNYDLATNTRNLAIVTQRGNVPAGGAAPGTGAFWNTNMNLSTSQYGVNNAGQVVFQSILTGGDVSGSTNNDGLWIGRPGSITLLYRKGQPAPSNVGDNTLLMDAAPTFGTFANGRGDAGWVSKYRVNTGTANPATLNVNQNAIFGVINGTFTELLRQNTQISGLPAGMLSATGNIAPFSFVAGGFTNPGTIFAHCKLAGAGVTAGVDDASIIKRDPATGQWSLAWRQNDATGIADANFGIVNTSNTRANNRGTLLLPCTLTGAATTSLDNQALFISLNGAPPQLIYRAGTPLNLPGLPADAQITTNSSLISQSGFGLNNLNQVVFQNSITSAEFTTPLAAVFAWTPKDGLMLIARADSQQFLDDLGGAPFLVTIDPRTNNEGGCPGFSDTGWIVMRPQDSFQHQAIYRAQLARCVGDYDCNAAIDGDDVIAFFADWDAGNSAADVDGSTGVDGDDVIAFFGGWDNGC